MEKNLASISSYFAGLPTECKTAEPPLPRAVKVRIIARAALNRLYRHGSCSIKELEADAAGRISGRLALILGAGASGRGGMRVIRDRGGHLVLCRDNVFNLLRHLGEWGFKQRLADENVDFADFEAWLDKLPSD
jgi:hypothetical protein